MFAAIKLLNYITKEKKSLSQIIDEIPPIIGSGEIRLKMMEDERTLFLKIIKEALDADKRNYVDIDGMRVDSSNGFWLLRKSNTEPHITLYCESDSKNDYDIVVNDLKYFIDKTGYKLTQL